MSPGGKVLQGTNWVLNKLWIYQQNCSATVVNYIAQRVAYLPLFAKERCLLHGLDKIPNQGF